MAVVVYGLVEPGTKLPRSLRGVEGGRPRVVAAGEVAALVGDLDGDVVEARRRTIAAYMDVLAAGLERSTVAPMRFGVVMAGDDEVRRELLEPLHDDLRDLLDRFENLVEMRVSARYDEKTLLAEIVAEDAGVRRLRGVAGRSVELGERVARAYERKCEREAAALLERLGSLVEDEEAGELPEWGLVTASFLVRRSRLAAFEHEVERWARAHAGRAACELAGPMPPYSFVELGAPEAAWA